MANCVPPLDVGTETTRICRTIAGALSRLHRRGLVLGISGGVDSAVCAALAVQAVGPQRVFGLLMPERESGTEGVRDALGLCEQLGIAHGIEDVTAALEGLGAYDRRDIVIRQLFPDFGPGWRQKIVLAGSGQGFNYFDLVAEGPAGERRRERMPADVYRCVVAATNMKQRVRKTVEYFHAERLNAAVLGTPNRLEYELGFFVRGGDGLADVKPIAHLHKGQVYQLAQHLGIPEAIRRKPPSTDTYSLDQTQEEFYFGLPWWAVDHLLWAEGAGLTADVAGNALGLTAEKVQQAWRDFAGKRRVAARSLADAILVEAAPAVRDGDTTLGALADTFSHHISPRGNVV